MELPRRAQLGAELGSDAETFSPAGMLVAGVVDGGMMQRSGVQPGTTISSIGGMPVRTLAELRAALRVIGATEATEIDGRSVSIDHHAAEPGARYGELHVDGARLRTVDLSSREPRALVVVIQGIACETVDFGGLDHPMAALVHRWFDASIDSLRVDKRGVGDSEGGPAHEVDFATELADMRAAIALGRSLATERRVPLYVFGHSVGGIIAALLCREGIDGVIAYGAPVMPWLECITDTIRRQLAMRGLPIDEIEEEVAKLDEKLRREGANGRTAAYHAQLAAIDIAAAWREVAARKLVVRGEFDWVVRPDDQARIPGATILDVPGIDHLLGRHPDLRSSFENYGFGEPDHAVADVIAEWIVSG